MKYWIFLIADLWKVGLVTIVLIVVSAFRLIVFFTNTLRRSSLRADSMVYCLKQCLLTRLVYI